MGEFNNSISSTSGELGFDFGLEFIASVFPAFMLFVCVFFCAHIAHAATPLSNSKGVSVDTSRVGDATHFEFTGASDWKYELKKNENGSKVTLSLQGMKPEALAQLRGLSDALIHNVSISDKGVDGAAEITFELAAKTDFFDYITEQPSRLIVDFFPKEDLKKDEGKTAENAKPTAKKLPLKATKNVAKKAAPDAKAANRKLASADDDGDDDSDEDGAQVSHRDDEDGDEPVDHSDVDHGLFTKDITEQITGVPGKKAKDQKRGPAGTDFVAVDQDNAPMSLADEISSQKDFSHGIFDGGDPEFKRFSIKDYEIRPEAVAASRVNFYLSFPMLSLGVPQLKTLLEAPPTYEIVPNDTRENKEARIILTLFSTGKQALLLKTADDFLKKYPSSAYDEIIRYMIADTQYAFWKKQGSDSDFEAAMSGYQLLTEKYPASPVTPRTALFMGYSYQERNDSFGALKAFQRFLRLSPNSKHVDQVRTSIAESYLNLHRFDEAYDMLDQLEKTAKTEKGREDAAFRKGDVFFTKLDWAEAIKQYKAAGERHPNAVPRYPNASYNTAEAEFRRQNYREALDGYRKFLQKFPDHEHGGYAMTRLGELLGIFGVNKERILGAYRESYFRYRSTPGAGIARIRMLIGRFPEMKEKEMASAIREIQDISKRYENRPKTEKEEADKAGSDQAAEASKTATAKPAGGEGEGGAKSSDDNPLFVSNDEEVFNGDKSKRPLELPGIEEFSTLLIADGLTARKEYDHAAQDLITYYQKNPQSPNRDRFKARIVNNLSLGIIAAVDRGDFIEGLRRWSKNSSGWLKNTDRVDVPFSVGRAYEQAGVFKEATGIYGDCLKRLADIKAAGQENEHKAFEILPSSDQLHLRLAAATAKDGDFVGAESHLKNISAEPSLNDKDLIERAEVSADVAEARGNTEAARKYLTDLIQTWKGAPRLTSPLHLRLAKTLAQAKDYKNAESHLATIIEMQKKSGGVTSEVLAKALELRGDLALARGKRGEAVKAYQELLSQYETKMPLAAVRYRLGKVLYEDGDLKNAEAAWMELKGDKDGLWTRLANEQMQSAKWQNEYKKYLNRIPAAADVRSEPR
jgi:tetratricopeptide (TPR) repeat protein